MKVILDGHEQDFDACVNLMDDEIREKLHKEMAGECSEQEFLDAYWVEHIKKYGKKFCI